MFNKLHSVLTSRLASTMLTAVLFAGLTAPFIMLQSTHVFAAPPSLPCTQGNNNGCTELSATPPEDIPAVPPNILLMFDDSGSMSYDYMPDWAYLSNTSAWGVRNSAINGVYYNPATIYNPPPKADGTRYPDSPSITGAYFDGFTNTAVTKDVRTYKATDADDFGHQYNFGQNMPTTLFNTSDVDKGPAVWGGGTPGSPGSPAVPAVPASCPANYGFDPADASRCIRDPVATIGQIWTCNSGDNYYANHGGNANQCRHRVRTESGYVDTWYDATDGGPKCPAGANYDASDSLCHYPAKAPTPAQPAKPKTDPTDPTPDYKWTCPSSGTTNPAAPAPPSDPPRCVAHSSSRIYVWAFIYVLGSPVQANVHLVIPNGSDAPAGGWCSVLLPNWSGYPTANCVAADDTSGTAAPGTTPDGQPALAQDGTPLTAGQNIANWFSYYRTRMLMSKSGLMTGLSNLDPNYRLGFASINGNNTNKIPTSPASPYTFDDSSSNGGGKVNNKLAVVQPFGVGIDADGNPVLNSQKTKFWNWLANASPSAGTPLRKALDAAGQYYKTAQPWSAMSGDPGYTGDPIEFSCRASYTILTTDGFWNGDDPAGIGAAANADGSIHVVPSGNATTHYVTQPPFSGGGVGGSVPSLADVATYYWANDLQPGMPNEVAAGSSDPATWQHMTTYTIGLGFKPLNIQPAGTTTKQIFGWAHALDAGASPNPTPADFAWPTPTSEDVNNIADLVHAAVNGRGDFFNANNPQDLANAFNAISAQIGARAPKTSAAVNASVLALGAVTFRVGYDTSDWHGSLEAITLKTDGTLDSVLWDAGAQLDTAYHSTTGYASRAVYTGAYSTSGTYSAFQFKAANKASLDSIELAGLQSPALAGGASTDTLDNRINYLLGDITYEGTTLNYRDRTSILGAILHSEPVYVAGATGNYRDSWPTFGPVATPITPPESVTGAQTFAAFVSDQNTRASMVYLAANDGMLHAFRAPVPQCTGPIDGNGDCTTAYTFATGSKPGEEAWAFMPRAVYANLGNLTSLADFKFRPTVDGTPVTRDVFFSEGGTYNNKWRTILTGGVGVGGRGVYGLDITDPDNFSEASVLWEFDADMAVDSACVSNDGACKGTDLGYTVAQPNIGRLSNGKWVVLVPNGYFPDCNTPDFPTATKAECEAIALQAPKDASDKPYSALFVLDAQTGKLIAELKTPTNLGVTSFGLSKPVMGDYTGDQVDDVAFAGDVKGNLWRFDLSDPDPAHWGVTLVYKGLLVDALGNSDVQPITTMPRLFPDPTTNRFLVLFGTGKYLGVGDNSNGDVQAIIAVRDKEGATYSQSDLTRQFLHEAVVAAGLPNAGASLRCVTGGETDDCTTTTDINAVSSSAGGWYVNLTTTNSAGGRNNAGERIVVNPGAIFASNTVIFESLITGAENTDACNPSTQGAILALNATTGGPAGVSSLGGPPFAGGRISNARTSGSLPVVSSLGGGKAYLPGATLAPVGTPIAIDAPIWRRRSWRVLMNDQ